MKLKLGRKDPTSPPLFNLWGFIPLLPLRLRPGQSPTFPLPLWTPSQAPAATERCWLPNWAPRPPSTPTPHSITLEDKEGKPAWRLRPYLSNFRPHRIKMRHRRPSQAQTADNSVSGELLPLSLLGSPLLLKTCFASKRLLGTPNSAAV